VADDSVMEAVSHHKECIRSFDTWYCSDVVLLRWRYFRSMPPVQRTMIQANLSSCANSPAGMLVNPDAKLESTCWRHLKSIKGVMQVLTESTYVYLGKLTVISVG